MKDELKKNQRNAQTPLETPAPRRKKKYAKPEVVYQAPLEAMAATCSVFPGKADGVCGSPFS